MEKTLAGRPLPIEGPQLGQFKLVEFLVITLEYWWFHRDPKKKEKEKRFLLSSFLKDLFQS